MSFSNYLCYSCIKQLKKPGGLLPVINKKETRALTTAVNPNSDGRFAVSLTKSNSNNVVTLDRLRGLVLLKTCRVPKQTAAEYSLWTANVLQEADILQACLKRKETQDDGRDCKYSGCGFKWLHNTRLPRRGWWVWHVGNMVISGQNQRDHSTTNPVWTALGSNTGFRGKVQRLSTTSTTWTYMHACVFIRGVRKIEKSDY